MKEIEKVSISGVSFTLDRTAFDKLNTYIASLEAAYKTDPDAQEIIADIEARIVELILSEQSSDTVVSDTLISRIIDRMGSPEDSGVPPTEESAVNKTFPKRLYRNPEGARFGGVCSGLATYFSVDVTILRVAIFAPLLLAIIFPPFFGSLFGSFVLLYFILWLSIPTATTPRQRMEMKGEKITASTIENHIKDIANRVQPTASKAYNKSAPIFGEFFVVLSRILLFGVKAIAAIIGISLSVAALIIFVVTIPFIFGANLTSNSDIMNVLSNLQGMSPEAYIILTLFAILIPLIVIILLLFRLVFNVRFGNILISILFGIWVLLVIFWSAITIKNASNIDIQQNHIKLYITPDRDIEWGKTKTTVEADSVVMDSTKQVKLSGKTFYF